MAIHNDPFCPIDTETGEAAKYCVVDEVEHMAIGGRREQISIRVPVSLLDRIEIYAKESEITRASAIVRLLASALEHERKSVPSKSVPSKDMLVALRQSNLDLRLINSSLQKQLSEKDKLIDWLFRKVNELMQVIVG